MVGRNDVDRRDRPNPTSALPKRRETLCKGNTEPLADDREHEAIEGERPEAPPEAGIGHLDRTAGRRLPERRYAHRIRSG
jgi:hypothetical protein